MDKRKGNELTDGTSKRSKKKTGETSLAFLPSSCANAELWKPKFSACELSIQVTMEDYTKDHDTSMAIARIIMLLNDVTDLAKENLKTIRGLLVMQQVQVSVATSIFFKLHF